jgi:dihydrofolate reductase
VKKIILQLSVSLDGYIEGPSHELDWHLVDDEFNAYAVEVLEKSDVLIMGRKTYDLMAGYWPTATDNDPVVKEQMNRTPKLVFSRTLTTVAWENSRLASGSIPEEVARLKKVPGDGQLWVGRKFSCSVFPRAGSDRRAAHYPNASAPRRRNDPVRRHQEAPAAQAPFDEKVQLRERRDDLRAHVALRRCDVLGQKRPFQDVLL